jgi:AcrR family transcriptional regulator
MPEMPEESLLQAVRDEVIEHGVRRATATSIAKRAGVSRMTVYRRGGGIKQLVLDALTREFDVRLASVATSSTGATTRDAVADGVVRGVHELSTAPLVEALLQHDAELLLPYLVERLGHSQQSFLRVVTPMLEAGMADGSIRRMPARPMAVVLLHAVQSFVISSAIVRTELDPQTHDAQVRLLVENYLRPDPDAP